MKTIFERVLDLTRDGLLCLSLKDRSIVQANRGLLEMLDIVGEPDELVGKSLDDLVSDSGDVERLWDRLSASGELRREELNIRTLSGKDRCVVFDAQVRESKACEDSVVEVFTRDITERKAAEEALRRSERRNRSLLEVLPDLMFEIDEQGTFKDYHASDPGLLAVPPETFLGKKCDEVLPPNVSSLTLEHIPKAIESGAVQVYEYSLELGDENRFFEARMVAKENDSVLCIIRDITERITTENRLKESEERFRDVTFSMGDWVWELDPDDVYTYCSPQVEQILGYTPDELLGRKTPFDLMPPEEARRVQQVRDKTVAVSRIARDVENWNLTKDGRRVCLLTNATPILDESGGFMGTRGVDKDITIRKRMEEEALKAHKLASLGVLAGGIAHDFNNILTSVMGNLSLARSLTPGVADAHERLAEAEKALIRAKDLTHQLLTFAKGGAPVLRSSSIEGLVRDSVGFALAGANVDCEMDLPEDLWPVHIDEGQVSQVIQNLVINAVQAMPDGGSLQVNARNLETEGGAHGDLDPGRYVGVSIRDEGLGIPQRHLARIFDPYFTTKQKGSGLGLAVSYSVMKNHGGQITVHSELDKGTTFEILLPVSDRSPPAAVEPVTTGFRGSGRILVMDDEDIVSEVIQSLLVEAGFEVTCVSDGEAAIESYGEAQGTDHAFDAVILDLTVPGGMGGKEAIKRLRKLDPDVRAVVSSGYYNDPVMAEFRRYGFRSVAAKPFKAGELADAVKAALEDSS